MCLWSLIYGRGNSSLHASGQMHSAKSTKYHGVFLEDTNGIFEKKEDDRSNASIASSKAEMEL